MIKTSHPSAAAKFLLANGLAVALIALTFYATTQARSGLEAAADNPTYLTLPATTSTSTTATDREAQRSAPMGSASDPITIMIPLAPRDVFLPDALAAQLDQRMRIGATPIPGFDAGEWVDTGQPGNAIVYNGDFITYTLILTNSGSVTITDLVLLDFLPDAVSNTQVLNEDTINLQCDTSVSTCQRGLVGREFPEPLGGTITVTATRWITWYIPILTPTVSTRLVINGRVEGQADGTTFANRAYADFNQGPDQRSYTFDEVSTIARVRVAEGGGGNLSQTPNWFSSDLGGTLSQDWGDFDRDGNLDLVLGSSLGATVYRNVDNRLQKFASIDSGLPAYGVRWADLNGDGRLELVTVGQSADSTPASTGINHVYSFVGDVFSETSVFTSAYQLVRVVAANLDHNVTGTIDLIASTNSINAPCPVRRFKNDGAGKFAPAECLSTAATAAIAVGDINNDGLPDLVLGRFPNAVRLLINHAGILTETNTSTQTNSFNFDTSPFLPYDFTWGDYDGDGFLDLVAAFPLQRQVRIYHNDFGSNSTRPLRLAGILSTKRFMTPLAVDWGDYNGDGALDLAVADDPPKVYLNQTQSIGPGSDFLEAGAVRAHGQVWSARAVALDNRNLSLSLSNQNGPSLLYETIGAHLMSALTPITGATSANSVAWGDADGDSQLDLLLGAGANNVPSKLYLNDRSHFTVDNSRSLFPSGFGPHGTAFGDLDGDGQLEAIIGTGNSRSIDAYIISPTLTRIWSAAVPVPVNAVALGDMNDDGKLDLLVGTQNGPVYVFRNNDGVLGTSPKFTSQKTGDARSVAWTDINGDRYMDFAVANYQGSTRIYRNNRDETFTLVFTSTLISKTTSLAWGDFNRDGYPDLAVGTEGEGDLIYENNQGTFVTKPVWTSPFMSSTTSIAWGDWDNDGQLDLAVGNANEPNQVYANLGSTPGSPRLFAIWQSADAYATTQVAWGDDDRDGYLDLAVSRQNGPSGVYHNTVIEPSHLSEIFTPTMPLPIHPAYLSIVRPGKTNDAYLYSSSELLSGLFAPTVTVRYRVYNPNGSRSSPDPAVAGGPITNTRFEYSVDGGATWKPASSVVTAPLPITQTTRGGQDGAFVWNAQGDKAISDNALFRIRVVDQTPVGPVQRAASDAVSPPFRVRGLMCVWPADPSFTTDPARPAKNQPVKFTGTIGQGSGSITYTWKFGDGGIGIGQKVSHTYTTENVFTVTMVVIGPPCPIVRPVTYTQSIIVGRPFKLYLPIIRRNSAGLSSIFGPIAAALAPAQTSSPIEPIRPAPIALPAPQALTIITATANVTSQLTNSPIGYNSQPAINGDGTRIAFWSTGNFSNNGPNRNPDGNVELFYAHIDRATGSPTFTQLTSSTGSILGGFNFAPSIDDGGDRVAFFSDRDLQAGLNPRHNFQIFLANIDDRDNFTIKQLTSPPDPNAYGISVFPSISADGQRIAFVSDRNLALNADNGDGNQEIFTVDLDANGNVVDVTQVTDTPSNVFNDQPALDADGRQITFISDHHGPLAAGMAGLFNPDHNQEIVVADLSNTGSIIFTQVTSTTTDIVNDHPRLSSDALRNVTVTYVSGDNVNRTVKADLVEANGNISHIGIPGENNVQPAINLGDGTRIIAVSTDGQAVSFLDTINLDATPIISVTDANATDPAISRNGMYIAYVSNRQIYVMYSPIANLAIQKTVDQAVIGPGGSLFYTIIVTNSGPDIAPNVIVTDTLPDNLKPLAPPGDQTDDNNDLDGFGGGALGQHNVTWDTAGYVRLDTGTPKWPMPNGLSTAGWFDMSNSVLLMHLDEQDPSTQIIADASGSNNSGICPAAPCPTSAPGQIDQAFAFNGGASGIQIVQVTDSLSLNFDAAHSFTIMGWVQSTAPGTFRSIMAKHDSGSDVGYLLYQRSNGELGLGLNYYAPIAHGGQIDDGQWHHVAAVIDRTGHTATAYVDGVAVDSAAFAASVVNSAPFVIGSGSYFDPYAGSIDEVAIFGRALSPTEIEMLYNWQKPAFRTGYFDSREMDGFFTTSWDRLNWTTDRPVDKELPNGNGNETGQYPNGPANMSNNALLLHLNETGGTTFADTSRATGNHNGTCSGTACPTPVTGKFNGGQYFGGNHYISINAAGISPPWTAEFWVKRQDSPNTSAILLDSSATSLRLEQYNGLSWVGITLYGYRDWSFGYTAPINEWVHLAFVASTSGDVCLFENGNSQGCIYTDGYLLPAPLSTVGARAGGAEGMVGALDEVAVYSRIVNANELADHYRRGLMRLKFQVRTCSTSHCGGNPPLPFIGPNGRSDSYYSELMNPTAFTPTLMITTTPNEFFQYRAYFESDQPAVVAPALRSVTIGPPHIKASPSRGTCHGDRTIVCNLYDMPPTSTATIALKVDVIQNAGGMINNLAEVGSGAVDHTPFDNTSTASTDVNSRVDLSITVLSPIASVVAGDNLTYTFIVTNSGQVPATDIIITGTLPPSVTLSSATASSGGICEPHNIFCSNFPDLPPDSHTTVSATFVTNVNQNKLGPVVLSVSTAARQTDLITANNTITLTTNVQRRADLSTTKTIVTPIVAGQRITYNLTVRNGGPSSANNIRITDTLPAGTLYVFATTPQCSGSPASNIVTCDVAGPIARGDSTTPVRVSVNISPEVRGQLTNSATATSDEIDSRPNNDTAVITNVVTAHATLTLTKSAYPATVSQGDVLTYTINVGNSGPSSVLAPIVTDILTRGLALKSITPVGICATTPITIGHGRKAYQVTQLDCALGRIDPNNAASLTVAVTVTDRADPIIVNTATVTASEATAVAQDTTTNVNASTTLHITKWANPEPAIAGRSITYTLAITNDGPYFANDVVVTDALPSGITFDSEVSSTPALSATIDPAVTPGASIVTWTIPYLGLNETGTIQFAANIDSAAADGQLRTNRAGIDSSTPHPPGPAFATFDSHIYALVNLSIAKSAQPAPVIAGQDLNYTIIVTNNGPSLARVITVTDVLDANTQYRSGCTHTLGTVTCVANNLYPLNADAFTIVVNVPPGTSNGTNILNSATVTATESPAVMTSNSTSTPVTTSADLAITKTRAAGTITVGAVLTYTLTYFNNGLSDAQSVLITDTLPVSLTWGGVVNSPLGAPTINLPNVVWNAGTLAANTGGTIVFTATVNSGSTGATIVNRGSIGSPTFDPDTNNNTRTDSGTITLLMRWLLTMIDRLPARAIFPWQG